MKAAELEHQENMADKGVLHRLLQMKNRADVVQGHAPHLPLSTPLTPARAAGVVVGRAAKDLYNLSATTQSATFGGVTLAELPEVLPEGGLHAVLQGPGDSMGVLSLCPDAVFALIEIQSVNKITARPVPKRNVTRADSLMCAEFINALLDGLTKELQAHEGFTEFSGFSYAAYLQDPKPLQLILEDRPHRSLVFKLTFGTLPCREAEVFLALPKCTTNDLAGQETSGENPAFDRVARQNQEAMPQSPSKSTETRSGLSLQKAVQGAPVEIFGVLCRRRISVAELRGLGDGDLLSLPRTDLNGARIELRDGQVLATGKLGEADGCHAIRLAVAGEKSSENHANPADKSLFMPGADRVEMPDALNAAMPVDLDTPDDFRQGGNMADECADSGISMLTGQGADVA